MLINQPRRLKKNTTVWENFYLEKFQPYVYITLYNTLHIMNYIHFSGVTMFGLRVTIRETSHGGVGCSGNWTEIKIQPWSKICP